MTNNNSVPRVVYVDHISCIDDQQLLKSVTSLKEDFKQSRIYSSSKRIEVATVRNSLSLSREQRKYILPYISTLSAEVSKRLVTICSVLELPPFAAGKNDVSCLAYGDGSFFLRHSDFTSATLYPRRLTWIYYFFKEPQVFTGGQLVFFKSDKEVTRVTPRSGMLVAFRADTLHETTAVALNSENFEDYRFAITCFVTGTPTLRSIASSTRCKLEDEFPCARVVTRPLTKVARRIRKLTTSSSRYR